MKLPLLFVKFFVYMINKNSIGYTFPASQKVLLDHPYQDQASEFEEFDLLLADADTRKDRLLIDVHGGGYHGGSRKGNHVYAGYYRKHGYDVLLADYPHAHKDFTIRNQFESLKTMIRYLVENKEKLNLTQKDVYLTGDSAGGHFALLLALWIQKENIDLPLRAVLLNCPVYDYKNTVKIPNMTKPSKRYFYGKDYDDEVKNEEISPRQHIQENKIPLFASSSTFDFIKQQFEWLQEDEKTFSFPHELLFIETENKKADHVHNVTRLELAESIKVNLAMLAFMDEYAVKE